MMIFIRKF